MIVRSKEYLMSILYRNWEEICKIGRSNKLLMLVLATIKIDENNPIFVGLYCGFTTCFSSEKIISGPVPLSVIHSYAGNNAVHVGASYDMGIKYPDSYDGIPASVPVIHFQVDDEHIDNGTEWPFFPMGSEEAKKLEQGDKIKWEGIELVILEINFNERRPEDFRIVAAPAECVMLDL